MTKSYETMFVGFVLGRCETLLATYRDDIPKEVYDSLVEMRDTARKIGEKYYSGNTQKTKTK